MRRARWTILALALAALGACTMVKGSGKDADFRWKVTVVEHPLVLSNPTFRGSGFDVVVERMYLGEARTVFGPEYWRPVVHAVVVNTSGQKIPFEVLSGKFTVLGQSGKVYDAHASTRGSRGKTGWLLQEHTQEPTHLPPGANGLIEVFTQVDGKDKPDAPAALTFLGQRAEVR